MATALFQEFDPKRTGETVKLGFDFTNWLDTGETLSTASNWTASVKSGTDASPGNLISGGASVSGTKSVQAITGGVDGVTYWLVAEVTTSAGQTLQALGVLEVQDAEV